MHPTALRKLIAIIGRASVALAMWAAAPLEASEAVVEAEAAAMAEADSFRRVETFRQCGPQSQLHYGCHTPAQCTGLTTFFGYCGRRLSPDLLAPLRC